MYGRLRVPAPRTPWGMAYFKFWFDTGVLTRKFPESFVDWSNEMAYLDRPKDARRVFEIMWERIILERPQRFLRSFDAGGVAKQHAWAKFLEGWRERHMPIRARGMNPRGFSDSLSFQNGKRHYRERYARLWRAYLDLGRDSEREWYQHLPRIRR